MSESGEGKLTMIRARAYGRLFTGKSGRIGGSVSFRIPRSYFEKPVGMVMTTGSIYRIKGQVQNLFRFEVYHHVKGYGYVIIQIPTRFLDRLKPGETYDVAVSSIEEMKISAQLSGIMNRTGHVPSWKRLATAILAGQGSEIDSQVGPVRELSEVKRAWLAGVVDGEGSIFITKLSKGLGTVNRRGFIYVPAINFSNSNEAFARRIKEIIGKGAVNFQQERRFDWKDRWTYRGSAQVLRGMLPQLIPYLLIKKDVAKKMLEYLTFVEANSMDGIGEAPPGYYEELDSMYQEIKRLNEKGNDSASLELLKTKLDTLARGDTGHRVTNCRQLSEEEKAWLAGVVDGEGSIFLSKYHGSAYRRGYFYLPKFLVSNSNREFLVRVQQVIGEGTVHLAKRGVPGTRTRWEYIAASGVLRAVLPQILPYLIVKQRQAETMLEFFNHVDENPILGKTSVDPGYYVKLDDIYFRMKKLNEKGKRHDNNMAIC